jgi:hypothetical protein
LLAHFLLPESRPPAEPARPTGGRTEARSRPEPGRPMARVRAWWRFGHISPGKPVEFTKIEILAKIGFRGCSARIRIMARSSREPVPWRFGHVSSSASGRKILSVTFSSDAPPPPTPTPRMPRRTCCTTSAMITVTESPQPSLMSIYAHEGARDSSEFKASGPGRRRRMRGPSGSRSDSEFMSI